MERHDEAVEIARRAVKLEPTSPLQVREFAMSLSWARRYAEAIEYSQKNLELDPNYPLARIWLASTYWNASFLQVQAHARKQPSCARLRSEKREARIRCNVLNRTAELGKPEYHAMVGE